MVERFGIAALEPVVELLADRARELVHELSRIDEVERAHPLAHEACGLVEKREVGLDLARRVRPLHLDGDAVPVRERRPVHLADRGGRDRGRIEVGEELLDRETEVLADHALDVLVRERPHVVLERLELDQDVRRDDVGPRREQLAELDEGRPELVEQLAQVLAALRGRSLRRELRPPRQQVGQAVGLEEVAEPVPDGHLRNLGEAPEVPRGGTRHAFSVAEASG